MKSPEPSLGVGILGVPERRERVARLTQRLGVGDEIVAWDDHHEGHVPTWWRAFELANATRPTHILLLEDDAEPCRDFLPAVRRLIARYPTRIMSFYSPLQEARVPNTLKLAPHYRTLSDVAVVYPRGWLEELHQDFIAHQEALAVAKRQVSYGADEMRLKLRPRQQVWNTVPSLVQHGCPHRSTLGHRIPHNLARQFIGAEVSALALDWTTA